MLSIILGSEVVKRNEASQRSLAKNRTMLLQCCWRVIYTGAHERGGRGCKLHGCNVAYLSASITQRAVWSNDTTIDFLRGIMTGCRLMAVPSISLKSRMVKSNSDWMQTKTKMDRSGGQDGNKTTNQLGRKNTGVVVGQEHSG